MLEKFTDKISNDIYDLYKKKGDSEPKRKYLGGSEIGHECERYLWYSFRHCVSNDFDGRMYKLFQRGHREEVFLVDDLRQIGCEVWESDANGKQFEVSAVGGHFKGHTDGVAKIPNRQKPHLLEFKTSSTKAFNKLKKEGVEVSKPQHFSQMQVYMHLMDLERALYLVVNKETDHLYSEFVKYDKSKAQNLIDKAERIVFSKGTPERMASRPDDFRCKFCSAHSLCWGPTSPEPAVPIKELSCRQCCFSTPTKEGTWICEKHKTLADSICDDMLFIPDLVSFAEPTQYFEQDNVIEFKGAVTWYHGNKGDDTKALNCEDLTTLPKEMVELPQEPK